MDKGDVKVPGDSEGIAAVALLPRNDGEVDSPESMEAKAQRGHELFEKLKELVSSRNRDAFALGAILKDVRDQQIYEVLGYSSFPEFCADPDIAFRKTSAYGFISLHETFVLTYKIDFQILGKIPYSKLLIVEPYVKPDNVDELLALARATASQDLREELRARKLAKRDEAPVEYRTPGQRLFDRYVKLPAADRGDFDREYKRWNRISGDSQGIATPPPAARNDGEK